MTVSTNSARGLAAGIWGLMGMVGAAIGETTYAPTVPTAVRHELKSLSNVAIFQAPPVDIDAVTAEDAERQAAGLPPRFAIPNATWITPLQHGTWEQIDQQTQVWRLQIASPGAASLNLGFSQFHMPEGAELIIYAADLSHIHRPFTHEDNAEHGELWTPVVRGDHMVVELTIAAASIDDLQLALTSVNVGYRGFGGGDPSTSQVASGSCNVDVICPEGDDWRLDIQSVAVISTGGSTFCTGFMVNNTTQDLKPYFMTAEHCGISSANASSLVAYWNYFNSWCRTPGSPQSGQPGDGLLNQFNTGAFWRAGYDPSDMTLVELDSDPLPEWDVAYAGWDRTPGDSEMAIAIHHPNTDEKRISFEFDPTTTTSYLGYAVPGNGTHVRVEDWDVGTTEPGSSGSPLFDENHRIIGQLHGGYASCSSQTSDWYGRISVSFTGGGTPSSRLSDWLDPGNTGAPYVDTVSLQTLCSSAGEVTLDRSFYACEDTATVVVVDCDLNLSETEVDSAVATIVSNSDPTGETVVLTETNVNTSRFEGQVTISTTDGPDVLQVAAGDQLTANYFDEDDGEGNSNSVYANALTDCTPPEISNVEAVNVEPRSATVNFQTDEPSLGIVHYGPSCDTLNQAQTGTDYTTSPSIDLESLNDSTDYFFSVEAVDEAGNASTNDNGGLCFAFTTPEAPDFFTEEFDGNNDLDNQRLSFTPTGGSDLYFGCAETIDALPTEPTGTLVSFSPNNDDGYAMLNLTGGATVEFYGSSYGTVYAGSNGYITFGDGDTDYTESLSDHFDIARISALFDDLDPSSGGTVRWTQLTDRVVVSYVGIPEYSSSNSNTFQFELFFDGRIAINYLGIAAGDGIAGLSQGNGIDPEFLEMDLTALGACEPPDCNENGIPDFDDIAGGTSNDCNGNEVPDECDISQAESADCNANGVPDECDLGTGTSQDCNANLTPDECDIEQGASPDHDENGVPDECAHATPLALPAGCRCITVTPQPVDGTVPVAIALNGAIDDPYVSCMQKFVQPDGTLGDSPAYLLPAQWGTINVIGQEILPDAHYDLIGELISGPLSEPATAVTWKWADTDNNGVANFADILHVVHGFQGDFSLRNLETLDIWPCTPDGLVNFEDVLLSVHAFQGFGYHQENCTAVCP